MEKFREGQKVRVKRRFIGRFVRGLSEAKHKNVFATIVRVTHHEVPYLIRFQSGSHAFMPEDGLVSVKRRKK